MGRDSYGFEIEKTFFKEAQEKMIGNLQETIFSFELDKEREDKKNYYLNQQTLFNENDV